MPTFIDHPVEGPITQRFGATDLGWPHRGVDYGVTVGTPVYAPDDGVVVDFYNGPTQWNGQTVPAFGIGICLRHDGGLFSLYAHLSSSLVSIGQNVTAGQRIGLSGNSGMSTGPHLHWQVCNSTWFPVDINQSYDPLSMMISEAERMALFQRLEQLETMVAGGNPRVSAWVSNGNISLLDCLGPQPAKVADVTLKWDGIEAQTYGTNNLLLSWRTALAAQGVTVP